MVENSRQCSAKTPNRTAIRMVSDRAAFGFAWRAIRASRGVRVQVADDKSPIDLVPVA
jgi:hypothetical protein